MNLLLDTHIALWAIADDPKLSVDARKKIVAPSSIVWVSTVSIWEIAIKHSLGKKNMPISGSEAMQYFQRAGYQFLSVKPEHAAGVEELPSYHQDPFDRLLLSQALIEPMRLITHDELVARYSDTVFLV